jgi:hypothetical protein
MLWLILRALICPPVSEVNAVTIAAFTAIDRCDRCGGQAYVRVQLPISGSTLDFCAHYFRRHEHGLADAILLLDDRMKLEVASA